MRRLTPFFAALFLLGTAANADDVKVGGDGLYHQDWFLQSFLDLKEDLQESADAGKRLVILWEQKGCPYCKELHQVNFVDPAIRKYIQANFVVLQLDIWGARPVTDFDGTEMSEKKLARRYGVRYTPTIQFLPATVDATQGKTGKALEVARMPGYLKPAPFLIMFRYVREKAYEKTKFRKYLRAALKQSG
ncbi:MAG: thioredoxin family protein [Rhodospirillaceae bacterium]|nr:thioredoxin family protein [Rhodospirillaceae bacterium]